MSNISEAFAQYKAELGVPIPEATPSIAKSFNSYSTEIATPKIEPETMAHKIGEAAEYLPTAGAVIGGGLSMLAAPGTAGASLLGGSALAGLGAAAGKAGEQIVKRMTGEEVPKTSIDAGKEIIKEGGWTAAINLAGGKVLEAIAPTAKVLAKQVLKGFARIDERAAKMVLTDPNILSRAKPLAEAKKVFSDFFKGIGFEYGPKSVKASTGKLALSDNAADDFISATLDKINMVERIPQEKPFMDTVVQEALATRYATGDAIKRAARAGNDSKARLFIEGKNQIDDWLETQIPGFANVRKVYEESKIKQAFSPLLPLNKNKETSVLGVLTSLGSALGAGGAFGPLAAVPAAAVSSPKLAGMAIKAIDTATKKPVVAGVSNIISKYLTPEIIKKEYKEGNLDRETAAQMLRENHGFQ